jgi:hypothetical protein
MMEKFVIKKRKGNYGRLHQLYIIDGVLFFDTADEEYGLGFISLRQLQEFINTYKAIENEKKSTFNKAKKIR